MKKLVRLLAVVMTISVLFWGIGDDVSAAKSKGPRIKTIIATQNYVKLEWSKTKKAKGYYVFKKTGNGSYKQIAELGPKTRGFTDKSIKVGTTYKYRIAAKKKGGKLKYGKAKQITPKYITPCKLKTLSNYYGSAKKRYSVITWSGSKSGYYYYIFRKSGSGSYVHIGTVKGVNGTQKYTDKDIGDGTNYTYTVRAVQKLNNSKKKKKSKKTIVEYWGNYDSAGIRTICQKVNVDGSIKNFQNLKTYVKWKGVSGATNYYVYRKKGFGGSYKLLATTGSGTRQYIDVYSKTLKTKDEKSNLFSEHFVDPDRNPYHYMVRAVVKKNGKISYSDYYLHGVFSLSEPQIMTVTKVKGNEYKVKFCEVYNAEKYEIYSATKSGSKYTWHKLKTVKPNGKNSQTVTVKKYGKDTYFSVKAISTMKGSTLNSSFETGFTIKNLGKLKGKKILYYGDSITYGSGYSGTYAYPIRVQQMLGGDYYNPSIPGATYSQKTTARWNLHPMTKRDRMYDQVGVRIRDGNNVIKSFNNTVHIPVQPSWGKTYDKYDVIIFAAGTKDYLDNAEIGDINSADPHTFCGAINMTMKFIQDGNEKRVSAGKAPIKVIFLNLFYSDRTYYKNWGKRTNRFKTKNDIGLTLTDYQEAQNALVAKYQKGYIFEPDASGKELTADDQGASLGAPTSQEPSAKLQTEASTAEVATETPEEAIAGSELENGDGEDALKALEEPAQADEANPEEAAEEAEEAADEVAAPEAEQGAAGAAADADATGEVEAATPSSEVTTAETSEEALPSGIEDDVVGLSNIKNGMKIYKMSTSFINQSNCPYLMLDNLHLSRVGSGKTGNALAEFLVTKVY